MAEPVLSLCLRAGDVIHICHCHDGACGECLSRWEIDAVVTEEPAPVGDRIAVKWATRTTLPAAIPAITGISLFRPTEQVLRIGAAASRSPSMTPAPARQAR